MNFSQSAYEKYLNGNPPGLREICADKLINQYYATVPGEIRDLIKYMNIFGCELIPLLKIGGECYNGPYAQLALPYYDYGYIIGRPGGYSQERYVFANMFDFTPELIQKEIDAGNFGKKIYYHVIF